MPKTATDPDLGRLEAQIAALRDDLAQIMTTFADLALTEASAKAEALRNQSSAGFADFGNNFGAKLDAVRNHTQQKPLQTLALAVAAGFLAGLIWGRR